MKNSDMKKLAFFDFEKEFFATGCEKVDGYAFSNFDNMTPAEKYGLLTCYQENYHPFLRRLMHWRIWMRLGARMKSEKH